MGREKYPNMPCWYPFWKDGSWCYDFYVEGERERRSTGVRDPEAVKIAISVAQGVHDAAWERALSPHPTFAEAAALYVAEYGKHARALAPIVDHFGRFTRVDEIDAFEIKKCKVALWKPAWKASTVRRQITTPLKAVLSNALGLRPERMDDDARARILSPEEAERVIRVAMHPPSTVLDPRRRLLKMIGFLLGCGATPGEMFCVRADDINRHTGEVWIRGEDPGAGKTQYRPRMVRPPARAWDLIGELPSEGRVFLTARDKPVVPDGKRGSSVIRQFHKLCDAAGLGVSEDQSEPFVFYSLRHTWATWFSAQVGDQDLLIDRGGWAKADTARRYRKRVPRDLEGRLRAHGWEFQT